MARVEIVDSLKKEIFKRFTKIEDEHKNIYFRGTGIGLSLTKRLVELLEGKIWVDSKYGEGSVFYFTLPSEVKMQES